MEATQHSDTIKRILIVYHSQSGNTETMAQAVAKGAEQITSVNTMLRKAADTRTEDLLACSGIAIGTPEYFGYMSGAIKDFFDRTYEEAHARTSRLPYFLFVSAGNDGRGAVSSDQRIVTSYRWKQMSHPLRSVGTPTPEELEKLTEMGMTLAAGVDVGIY